MNNIWHNISPSRIKNDDFIAVIEIEKGSKNLKLDLILRNQEEILRLLRGNEQLTELMHIQKLMN